MRGSGKQVTSNERKWQMSHFVEGEEVAYHVTLSNESKWQTSHIKGERAPNMLHCQRVSSKQGCMVKERKQQMCHGSKRESSKLVALKKRKWQTSCIVEKEKVANESH